jgi:hypothetical protein
VPTLEEELPEYDENVLPRQHSSLAVGIGVVNF